MRSSRGLSREGDEEIGSAPVFACVLKPFMHALAGGVCGEECPRCCPFIRSDRVPGIVCNLKDGGGCRG